MTEKTKDEGGRMREKGDEGGRMRNTKDEGGRMKDEVKAKAGSPSSLIPHPSSLSPDSSLISQTEIGKILIADDEEIVHLTVKRLLESEGYTIDSAYEGKKALDKLTCRIRNAEVRAESKDPQSGYDLLVLDIRMPDMDGISLLREIRRREIDIEVLILTGYATMETATQALSYGARGYITKPIENVRGFRNMVREAVHIGRLARQNKQFYDAIVSGQVESLTIDGKVYLVPALREENKEVFQRLMEVVRDGVVFLDFDGNITFANICFARMIGESYQDLLGARFESFVAEGDQDHVIEAFTRLSTGQVDVSIPVQLKTKFDNLLSIIISASPIYYKTEYRGILAVISDITEISAVRERVELLANLVENAQYDIIFVVTTMGQIMQCNSLANRSFGYSQSEMLSRDMQSLLASHTDPQWSAIMESTREAASWRGELVAVSKDKNEFPVEITVSRPTDADKVSNTNVICIMRDLTERKKAEKLAAEAQEQRIQDLEREIKKLDYLTTEKSTPVTSRMFGSGPLRETAPQVAAEIGSEYGVILDQALIQRGYKTENLTAEQVRTMATRLGGLRASPRDVVEIHAQALREKIKSAPPQKARAYIEEGRLLVLELMGHLAAFYRVRALPSVVSSPSKSDRTKVPKEEPTYE